MGQEVEPYNVDMANNNFNYDYTLSHEIDQRLQEGNPSGKILILYMLWTYANKTGIDVDYRNAETSHAILRAQNNEKFRVSN